MKKRTRVTAWIYLFLSLICVYMLLSDCFNHADCGASARLDSIGWAVSFVAFLIGWIYLLRKRRWAWWMLLLVSSFIVGGVWPAIFPAELCGCDDGSIPENIAIGLLVTTVLCVVPIKILMADKPWEWDQKRIEESKEEL